MQAAPIPDTSEIRANTCFEMLLWALSRPGQIRSLPDNSEQVIVEALLDRECKAFATDEPLKTSILRTGANLVEPSQADHLFFGTLSSNASLMEVNIGTDLYPDDGATVILHAQFHSGPQVCLSGPGIETVSNVQISGLPDGFWQTRDALLRYPKGFDLFFIDGDQVMGIPRSTKVEMA